MTNFEKYKEGGSCSEIPNNSDCVSRQAVIDAVSNCGICIQRIVDLPSTQPEIIRCKDCTWCQNDTVHGKVFCSREGAMDWIEPDSFCSYAERKTNGSD